MRILIIRHGDPDYSIDSLTEKGRREAELLSARLAKEGITDAFVSPLGRARDTARPTLDRLGMSATVLDWLREFPVGVEPDAYYREAGLPDTLSRNGCPWNVYPQYRRRQELLSVGDGWRRHPMYASIVPTYDAVAEKLNALLASYGYRKNGTLYDIDPHADEDRCIAFFCHMGLGLVLLSMLSEIPMTVAWGSLFLPTTSVTTIFMEKFHPIENQAQARFLQVGDTSHLFAGGEPVSNSGLQCEVHGGLFDNR